MAKNSGNNVFGFTGTLGNIVGFQWHGIQCFRARPNFVRNPNSPKQVAQRTRFKAIQLLAKQCLSKTLKEIWKRGTVEMTGYNLFTKKNIRIFDELGKITDYSKLKLSVGILPLPNEFVVETRVDGNCVVTVSWEHDARIAGFNPKDRLQVVAIINSEVIHVEGLTARRSDETATFQLPCGGGTLIHLYIYFYNEGLMDGSPSYYQLVEVPNE
jgi:hypothetical protein